MCEALVINIKVCMITPNIITNKQEKLIGHKMMGLHLNKAL